MALHVPLETRGAVGERDQRSHDRPNPYLITNDAYDNAGTEGTAYPGARQTAEEWRDVPGFEGFYEASDTGRVRSLDRVIETADGHVKRLRGVELAPVVDRRSGVRTVSLCTGARRSTRRVGALVLAAFGEPQPWPWAAVRHLDGDRANCRLENLAWARMGGAHR